MLDQSWYQRLKDLLIVSKFQLDIDTFGEEKRQFLAGATHNPHLTYQLTTDANYYTERRAGLEQFLIAINASTDLMPSLRALYLERVVEELSYLAMFEASYQQNYQEFLRQGALIHGTINPEWWYEIVRTLSPNIQSRLFQPHLEGMAPKEVSALDIKKMKPLVSRKILDMYPYLESLRNKQYAEVDAVLIQKSCQEFLVSLGVEGWKVALVDTTASGMSVNRMKKLITIPTTRKISADKLLGLMVHEIGTHVMRSVNAAKTGIELLSLGLAGYTMAEEGLATMCSQAMSTKKWRRFAGEDKYVAIGLAIGVDGKPRDFREVFEMMQLYYLERPTKAVVENREQKTAELAWQTAVRVFRGTDGMTRGMCYTKDLVYYHGNRLMWQLFSEDQSLFPQLFIGKFSPFDSVHMDSLRALGVL